MTFTERYQKKRAAFKEKLERQRKRQLATADKSRWSKATREDLQRQVVKMETQRYQMAGKIGTMKTRIGVLKRTVEDLDRANRVLRQQIALLRKVG